MTKIKKSAAILGSTGSVGRQSIDALMSAGAKIRFICGSTNTRLLSEQARLTGCEVVAVPTQKAYTELKTLLADTDVRIAYGENAVCEEIEKGDFDIIVHAIAGMAGIPSALAASKTGARLAIANKESIISLGDIIYENVRNYGGELIPVDSEHSAIFQCLQGSGAINAKGDFHPEKINRILLTASGGPFFGQKKEDFYNVTPETALAHPTWKMGPKITIDCATLMNKGFEVIEATRLFGVDTDKIEVLVHRQSIVHSMVEFTDKSVIAQLGLPDMRHCVRYALSYPDRMEIEENGLDFTKIASLTFAHPDREAFPLLEAAFDAYKRGTNTPAALISADEEAVGAFLRGEIPFGRIAETVLSAMADFKPSAALNEKTVLEGEKEGRELAKRYLKA